MKDNKELAHDRICSLVEAEFRGRGFKTLNHYTYYGNKRNSAIGEIDIIAWKTGYKRAIVIEVKYNDNQKNRNKAKEQLNRSEHYCKALQEYNITKMYAYHQNKCYVLKKVI